jgi:DNA-binding Xre family transcriptional regulator
VERRVRNISLDNVERLAQALDVNVFDLLTPTNPAWVPPANGINP